MVKHRTHKRHHKRHHKTHKRRHRKGRRSSGIIPRPVAKGIRDINKNIILDTHNDIVPIENITP